LDSIEATVLRFGRFANQLETLNDTRGDRLETYFAALPKLVNESRIVVDYSDFVGAAQPEEIRKALAANAEQIANAGHAHGSGDLSSMRYASYKGHQIAVRTTYEITVDGRPFAIHVTVDNNGRVHYHGLPTRDFASIIGLVQKAIDMFPEDFRESGSEPDPDDGSHYHEDTHEHPHDSGK
jgi:hypothetical protein